MGRIIGLVFKPAAEEKRHICPVCGKEFKSAASLKKHAADKHPAPEPEPPAMEPEA